MKNLLLTSVLLLSALICLGQNAGNVIYQDQIQLNRVQWNQQFGSRNVNVQLNQSDQFVLSVKGLYNAKADSFIACFSVIQEGKTAVEVNELMDKRIGNIREAIKSYSGAYVHVDMVTFLPMYEYELEKKIFSKNTYNEIPVGFKLKKNLHISFADADFVNTLVRICAKEEVYDLIKVDYVSNDLESKKDELVDKAIKKLKGKMDRYELLLGIETDTLDKRLSDGFKVFYPVESYQSCSAYSSSSISNKAIQKANVHDAQKETSQYYQAIPDKDFDFVINPVVTEPAIQVVYEIKLLVRLKKPEPQIVVKVKEKKKVMILTPDGNVRPLDLD